MNILLLTQIESRIFKTAEEFYDNGHQVEIYTPAQMNDWIIIDEVIKSKVKLLAGPEIKTRVTRYTNYANLSFREFFK